jgi:hypothetical protein
VQLNSKLGLTVVVLMAIRCGSGTSQNGDGGTDANNGNDGTSGNDGSGGDSGNDGTASSKPYAGGVYLSESKTQNTTSYSASASFYAVPDSGTTSGACAGTKSGNCCYTPPSQADGGTTSTTPVGAGGITIKDGTTTIATLTPTGTTYTPVSDPPTSALTWNAGDTINISAAGDTVHAFSGMVTAAALFAGVSPALSYITPIAITRSSDFTITWTAGTGKVTLLVSALKVATSEGVIVCSAADTGTMTVPTALLTNFSAGDTGVVTLTRAETTDASNDNATITLSSSTSSGGTATFN